MARAARRTAGPSLQGESALRLHWHDAGLPRPELQFWVYDDDGIALYRLDIALPDMRFTAEYDGAGASTPATTSGSTTRGRRSWLDEQRRWVVEAFEQEHVYSQHADPAPRLQNGARLARTRSGLWVPESAYRPEQ